MKQLISSIVHEIARVVDARNRVPEWVSVRGKKFQITYLDDHKMRLEEALRRRDARQLKMLYSQLQSRVKYQLLRATPERLGSAKKTPTRRSMSSTRNRVPVAKTTARSHKKSGSTSRRFSRAARN